MVKKKKWKKKILYFQIFWKFWVLNLKSIYLRLIIFDIFSWVLIFGKYLNYEKTK